MNREYEFLARMNEQWHKRQMSRFAAIAVAILALCWYASGQVPPCDRTETKQQKGPIDRIEFTTCFWGAVGPTMGNLIQDAAPSARPLFVPPPMRGNELKAPSTSTGTPYRTYSRPSSHVYITGPRGGCYYINSRGNKEYVARSLCN